MLSVRNIYMILGYLIRFCKVIWVVYFSAPLIYKDSAIYYVNLRQIYKEKVYFMNCSKDKPKFNDRTEVKPSESNKLADN